MDKPAILIILDVIIASTLINILFFGNKKLMKNPKEKRWFKISLIIGIIVFIIVLVGYFSIK